MPLTFKPKLKGTNTHSEEFHLIEAINVLEQSSCKCSVKPNYETNCETIKKLDVFEENGHKFVIAAFEHCIVKVPVATCQHSTSCCQRFSHTFGLIFTISGPKSHF